MSKLVFYFIIMLVNLRVSYILYLIQLANRFVVSIIEIILKKNRLSQLIILI